MPDNTAPGYCESSIVKPTSPAYSAEVATKAGKWCKLRRLNPKGFTLVEIVTALVIIGVLSVIAAVRFTGTSTISVRGAADMIQADIRYAQEAAMAEHTAKSVIFSTGSSAYTFSPASGMDPLGKLPSEVTISSDTVKFTFNTLGEPSFLPEDKDFVKISAGGQYKTIRVTKYTGKVGME